MTRKEKLKAHKKMMKLILDKERDRADEIENVVKDFYDKKSQKWNELANDIITIIYSSLEETYKLTIKEGSKIYKEMDKSIPKTITKKEIDKYTYDKDNKTLEERIKQYVEMAKNEETIRDVLIHKEKKILENETRVVSHKILKKRLKSAKIEYGMVVPGGGCDRECCNESTEEWMPIDEIDEPPYHPYCTCEVIYGEPEDDDEEL